MSFANPFNCTWPNPDQLIADPSLATSLIASGLDDPIAAHLEEAVVKAIVRRGPLPTPFDPERDFIQHIVPGSTRVWQNVEGELAGVDERVALEAMQMPIEQAAFFAGLFPRLSRFTLMHAEPRHACVIIQASAGSNFSVAFWHVFRSGFGLGPWWVISQSELYFGW